MAQSPDILEHTSIGGKLFQAYAATLFFLQGKLAFKNSIQPLFQGGFKTKEQRAAFRHLYFEFINKKYGSFTLYGNPFSPASENYVEAIAWIDEVITKDQYQTNLIKDDAVVIDAGANIGIFSMKVAHNAPDAKVYSFEPTPRTFATLKKNTERYQNISIVNCGLGEAVTQKDLLIWDDFSGSNSFGQEAMSAAGKPDRVERIALTTIDEVAKNLPRVDFIKMDVEGHEANILHGAAETIKKWKPIIAMSAYHNADDKEKLPALLKSFCPDYVCELRHDAEEDMICRVR